MIDRANPRMQVAEGATGYLSAVFLRWLERLIDRISERWIVTPIKTAAYTANPWEMVLCNPTAGGFTVTLPDPRNHGGAMVAVKNASASANVITLATVAGATIELGVGATIAAGYAALTLFASHEQASWIVT